MPYKFNPFTGKLDNAPGAPVFNDAKFTIFDDGDKTRKFQFEASAISPSTTRVLDIQDVDGPVAIGYGSANQYIRGDATIANFPNNIGGGSLVSYYLNGSVSQGTIGGNAYQEISRVPAGGPQTNFSINAGSTTVYFVTDAGDPNLLTIPAGNFIFTLYCSTSSGNPNLAVELYKYDGVSTFTQIGATSPTSTISNTSADIHLFTVNIPSATTLLATDRLAIRVIGSNLGGHTITLFTESNTNSQFSTTFSTGITALNGLTDQVQFFATGTTGTDFTIASTGATHTFNIPVASGTNTGKLSAADWTTFNNKIGAGLYTATTGLTMNTARILARTTAGVGAAEEISIGTGLSLAAGVLSNTAAGVTSVTATAPITSSGGATPDISTSMNTDRLIGRTTAGTGVMEEISTAGTLTLTGGTLTGTGVGGSVGAVDNAVLRADVGTGIVQNSNIVIDDLTTSTQRNVAITVNEPVFSVTGDASTDVITATGHNYALNDPVVFLTLTGGSPLGTRGAGVSYFVRDVVAGTSFKLSSTSGGGAIDFTTNITAGTIVRNTTLVASPSGTGAFIVGLKPDGTALNGNARGQNAVDLQIQRTAATQVASGRFSFVAGGGNTASAEGAVSLGYANTASGFYSTASGESNTASASGTVALGNSNSAQAQSASCPGGRQAIADRYSMVAHSSGRFAANGDAQRARFVLRCKTTTNAAVEMALDGSTTYLTIPSGKVIFMNIKVVGTKSDGSAVATYERQYAVKNVAATSSEVYAPITIGTDNAAGTTLEVATVDAGDYVRIRPTGITSETWRWVASVDAVEVAYGT
jgi:hypothetical protein